MASTNSSTPDYPPGTFTDNFQPPLYAISAVFLGLVTISFVLRFLSRYIGKIRWMWDDTLICLSYIAFIGLVAACLGDVVYGGAGRHLAYIIATDPGRVTVFFQFMLAIPLLYVFSVMLPKLALIALYLQIFTGRWLRVISWACAGIIVANWFANTVAGLKACTPISYLWTQFEAPGTGTCFDINSWFRWCSFVNIVTDVVMLLLPIPMVLKLQVPTAVRVGLLLTFLLGSLGLIASIFRFVFFYQTNAESDQSWAAGQLVIWTEMEVGMYIMAASLPCCRPLLRYLGIKAGITRKGASGAAGSGMQSNRHDGKRGTITNQSNIGDTKFSMVKKGWHEEDEIALSEDFQKHAANNVSICTSESDEVGDSKKQGGIHVQRDVTIQRDVSAREHE